MDNLDRAARSRVMASVKSRDTGPEKALRRLLWRAGVRYRLHARGLPGRPDISNRQARVAVFVDGCFWHKCPRHYRQPASNAAFWRQKVAYNQHRRATVRRDLGNLGWKVVEVWECDLRGKPEVVARRVTGLVERGKQAGGRWRRPSLAPVGPAVAPPKWHWVSKQKGLRGQRHLQAVNGDAAGVVDGSR